MGTINHLYDPDQDVYVIDNCYKQGKNIVAGSKVLSGTVIRVQTVSVVTGVEILYDIRLTGGGTGTSEFTEEDVFANINDAMVEYETRVV